VVTRGGVLIHLENTHPEPESAFRTEKTVWAALISKAELVIHSHPSGQQWASYDDQVQQIATGLPWCIAPRDGASFFFGDAAPRPALDRRPFRWGVTDCYACARDVLEQTTGYRPRNYARRWKFHVEGEALFENALAAEGFEIVSDDLAGAVVGDLLLFRIRSGVANHCGVVSEPGHMIHHPTPRLPYAETYVPTRERLERWQAIPLQVARRA